jgi:hypothetical protein
MLVIAWWKKQNIMGPIYHSKTYLYLVWLKNLFVFFYRIKHYLFLHIFYNEYIVSTLYVKNR